MSDDPKPINKPMLVCHICGRPAVAYDQHRRFVCAIHSLHPYAKFNLNQGSKPGRNAPCPCGSEKRFKVCCGKPVPLQIPGEKTLVEENENA